MPAAATLRPARTGDLAAVVAVQAACYGAGFLEPEAVLRDRLRHTAGSWRVAQAGPGAAARVVAYLAAYPSRLGAVTPLHGAFAPADPADALCLHDLAVHPDAAGHGLGAALTATLLAQARADGLRWATLVAVQGAAAFWQRQGFAERGLDDAVQRARLAGYGAGAAYMVRALQTGVYTGDDHPMAGHG